MELESGRGPFPRWIEDGSGVNIAVRLATWIVDGARKSDRCGGGGVYHYVGYSPFVDIGLHVGLWDFGLGIVGLIVERTVVVIPKRGRNIVTHGCFVSQVVDLIAP